MLQYFNEYVRKIIIFLIFTSFLQIIMPSTKYKNYLHLILGMILIFIMVDPINKIYKNFSKFKINSPIFEEEDAQVKYNEEKFTRLQNEMMMDFFTENIKSQIEKIIGNKYKVNGIDINLEEDKYYNVVVKGINLDLIENKKVEVYIKPFSKKEEVGDNENNFEKNKIKKLISDFYNLHIDNIFIKIT